MLLHFLVKLYTLLLKKPYLVVLKFLSYCHIQMGMVFLISSGSRLSVSSS